MTFPQSGRRVARAAAIWVSLILPAASWAQQPTAPSTGDGGTPPPAAATTTGAAAVATTSASGARLVPRPLQNVVADMARASGVTIVADSSVATVSVVQPAEDTTEDSVATQLTAIVKTMPEGTTWAKVYLPGDSVRRPNADAVSDYIFAQARLFGGVGAATAAGTVEIMGQKVPADKASSVISILGLKPVYLITNPRLRSNGASAGLTPGAQSGWGQMTPDQRRQFAQQEAQDLMSMDPAAQQEFIQQQQAILRAMYAQMSPQQRQEFRLGSTSRSAGQPPLPSAPATPGSGQ